LRILRKLPQLVFALTILCAPAGAQGVTVEVQPPSIALSQSYADVQARIILKNSSSKAIESLTISCLSNDGPTVKFGKPSSSRVEPGSDSEWSITVENLATARIPATILFDVSYRVSATPANTGPQHAFASLAIASQTDGTSKPIEASIEGNFDAVSEQRPATGYIVVANNLNVTVKVTTTLSGNPGAFKIGSVDQFDVPAHSTVAKSVTVGVETAVTPGVYPIVFDLSAKWTWAGRNEERHIELSKQATAGVFFESEVLKALGVPSFLVLPGCLMVFTFQLLVMFGAFGIKNESGVPQSAISALTVTTPGFWIAAITFSGLFEIFYSWATDRNLLLRYGGSDLLRVWLWSIVAGATACIAYGLIRKKWRADHVFKTQDDPVTVLEKLSRNDQGIFLPEVRFKISNLETSGLLLEPLEDGQSLIWIAPPIKVTWGSSPSALEAQRAFETSLNSRRSAQEIATKIREGLGAQPPQITQVRWNTLGFVANPLHLKVDLISEYKARALIVR
jgi:hypothetical protein